MSKQDVRPTWIGVYPDLPKPFVKDKEQKIVNNTIGSLLAFLQPFLQFVVTDYEIKLSLVQDATNPRLARGMNEEGRMGRDFEKSFTGKYFESLSLTIHTKKKTLEKTKEFLKMYVEGLVIDYFIQYPSEYSNWELSYRNRKGNRIATAQSPAAIINFPYIQIKKINVLHRLIL